MKYLVFEGSDGNIKKLASFEANSDDEYITKMEELWDGRQEFIFSIRIDWNNINELLSVILQELLDS